MFKFTYSCYIFDLLYFFILRNVKMELVKKKKKVIFPNVKARLHVSLVTKQKFVVDQAKRLQFGEEVFTYLSYSNI